jgi:hypothetical protein
MRALVIAIAAALIAAPIVLVFFEAVGDIRIFGIFSIAGWNSFKALIGVVFLVAYAWARSTSKKKQGSADREIDDDKCN